MSQVTQMTTVGTPALLVLMVLALVTVSAVSVLLVLNHRLRRVLKAYSALLTSVPGDSPAFPDLTTLLTDYVGRHQALALDIARLQRGLSEIREAMRKNLQRVGLVRFNAFEKVGGEQSFAVAILDEDGNGVVVTSLYGREESRVYAKPVRVQGSAYALSAEERQAVNLALARRPEE